MREEQIGGKGVRFVGDVRTVIVYAIADWNGKPVYIGSTSQILRNRIRCHILDAKNGSPLPIHEWLRAASAFQVIVLQDGVLEHSRSERERFWVSQYPGLLNITDGGPGGSGAAWSAERKERVAASIRSGDHFDCQTCGVQFWRKQREIKLGQNKFCSRECYAASRRGVHRAIPEHVRQRGIEAAAKARNARTQCLNGHGFSPENTRFNKNGARVCRTCEREHKRSYLERQHA